VELISTKKIVASQAIINWNAGDYLALEVSGKYF
jgi:hypothetical protein